MKKTLLTLILAAPIFIMAQTPVREIKMVNQEAQVYNAKEMKAIDNETPIHHTKGTGVNIKEKKGKPYQYVTLGETYYDLQTNASPGRRVVLHADGTVSAVWTTSGDGATNFPNRGTGYNYFDGSDWLGVRSDKIEGTQRSGWPNIMELSNGKEAVFAHESNTGGFIKSVNSGIGSTAWSSSGAVLDDVSVPNVNRVPIWGRAAAGNGYVHLISNYWLSESTNVPAVIGNGVTSPTTYSRSSDDGETWEVEHILLPGYDSTLYASGGGDNYAIDVKDSIVAIVIGGLGDPISLWKSTDNGVTFTYTDVDKMPYKGPRMSEELTISGDTLDTNDGSLDVLIDNDGVAHVFWGFGLITGGTTETGDTSFFFFPGQSTVRHWKEGDTEPRVCGSSIDMDGDGALSITSETINALDASGNVPSGLLSAARNGTTSITTMPSASIDANGNLYMVYSSAIETNIHFLNANFRDILVSYSDDGGATWYGPQNITQDRNTENTFPCVAKRSNEFLHLIFQQDNIPGTFLQNNANGTHPNEINEIKYAAVPTSAILNNEIGQNTLGEEKITKKAEVFVVSQNQPNPFFGSTDVVVYLQSGAETTLTVTDLMGKVINQGSLGILPAGNSRVSIDGNGLQPGLYFYTLSTPEHSVTKKMQVK